LGLLGVYYGERVGYENSCGSLGGFFTVIA
jgi:hypothetical protein